MTYDEFIMSESSGHGGYGLGDIGDLSGVANCPSIDQLNGIVNPNDPCQGAPASAGSDYQTISTPQGDYQVINGVMFDPNGKPVSGTSLPISGGGIGLSPTVALWGLVAIAAVLLIGGGGRRR